MTPWANRPVEIANLFNPALCSTVLHYAVGGYIDTAKKSMPFPLAFLVLPAILHKRTREAFPRSVATKFHSWVETNQHIKINLSTRTREMTVYTKEAIIFGVRAGTIGFDENGDLIVPGKALKLQEGISKEVFDCYKRAYFMGRWLSQAGDVTTIYMTWGIHP